MSNNKVREILWGDPDNFAANFLNQQDPLFNEDYVGIVVDNDDPDKLGRCKINVFGLFDEVNKKDLPWAMPDFDFMGSKVGSFIVPPVGCIVKVYFENGDVYFPKYSNKVVDKSKLPKNHAKDYPNTMIFFETDKGSSFEINRKTDEAVFNHFTGTTLTIDKTGAVLIKTHKIVDVNKLTALPAEGPLGHFNTIPTDPYTGMVHTSNTAGV